MLFDIGDTAHIAITFADLNGVPTNPSTVALTLQAPDNTSSTPTPINDGAGLYHYDLALTQSGIYRFKWQGTGTVAAVEEGEIAVKASILVPQPPGTIIVADLIRSSLRLAGLMDQARRKASPEQLDEGVETFNEMMDFWRAQGWRVPCTTRTLFPLTPQRKVYTIGPDEVSPNFTAPRPPQILQAGAHKPNAQPGMAARGADARSLRLYPQQGLVELLADRGLLREVTRELRDVLLLPDPLGRSFGGAVA